jgi:hypothetical protein
MTMPQVKEYNQETSEEIIRDMTDEEYQAWLDNQAAIAALEEKTKADAIARTALLARLGITAEEAQLLLGSN